MKKIVNRENIVKSYGEGSEKQNNAAVCPQRNG